jgi:hypothetical protein
MNPILAERSRLAGLKETRTSLRPRRSEEDLR